MSISRMEAKNPVVRQSVFPLHQGDPQEPALNATVRAQIGRRLRVLFDGEVEPAPDRFGELLAQLDARLNGEGEGR